MTRSGNILAAQPGRAGESLTDAGSSGWYLYGITHAATPDALRQVIESAQHAAMPGATGELVQALIRGELAAIVSIVPLADFDSTALGERLNDVAWLQEMAWAHNAVIAAVHERQAILPAKFGSVYLSRDDLGAALDDAQERLLAELSRLQGCDEWAIHLYADRAVIEQQVTSEHPALQRLRDEISVARPGRAYFLQRKLAGEEAAAVDDALVELARGVITRLRPYALDVVQENPTAGSDGAVGDEIEILRAALLIERKNQDVMLNEFEASVLGVVGLRGASSGPWPPYSFVARPEEGRHDL